MLPLRLVALCVLLVFCTATRDAVAQSKPDHDQLVTRGFRLSAEEAEELQKKAAVNPEDLESRIPLLTYYFGKSFQSPDAQQAHQELALWFIEKHPEVEISGNPQARIDQHLNPEGYAKAKSLWLANTEKDDATAIVFSNAANFFLLPDRKMAEKFIKKAQELEPDNPDWSEQLGHLYDLDSNGESAEDRQALAKKALVEYERAFNQQKTTLRQFFLLPELAKVAFDAQDYDKAKKYARELLLKNKLEKDNWNSGNAVHHGNLILGRIMLHDGDVEKAKSYLLAAGKTKGSPQLDSFGPNMTLAKELLEKGEKQVVLEYFDLCEKFWKHEELDQWRAMIKGGGVPDFGANLDY